MGIFEKRAQSFQLPRREIESNWRSPHCKPSVLSVTPRQRRLEVSANFLWPFPVALLPVAGVAAAPGVVQHCRARCSLESDGRAPCALALGAIALANTPRVDSVTETH
ncbi:unnamed protein product [Lampetra planeri]